ncbi:hypothetical protein Leryth_021436 [Lithospermum erythrorhizon]|nr:hypothetical protein Leryth_021436 [Lithospermum erythrorhizon]
MMEEAKGRWLRPNEIHAILCNYKHFTVYVKPANLPKSGTVVLFDRKKLRNFRKDGHNWKKKKDGKTVKEAHEHLKVGNEEKIHVYYAHGEDNPTFVRRCYWLLDKTQEHIVLVHYRETQETQGSPSTPVYSSPGSGVSDPPMSWPLTEDADSVVDPSYFSTQGAQYREASDSLSVESHEMRLREINMLEWDELVMPDNFSKVDTALIGRASFSEQPRHEKNGYGVNGDSHAATRKPAQSIVELLSGQVAARNSITPNISFQPNRSQMISDTQWSGPESVIAITDRSDNIRHDGLESQDSFGRWMNLIITDSPTSLDDVIKKSPISIGSETFASSPLNNHQSSSTGQIFSITDISPAWGLSSEETKILVVGVFHEIPPSHMDKSNIFCVCGSACVTAELVQPGVFRCLVSPQTPGLVNLFLSFDGQKPISQPATFEFRAPVQHNWIAPSVDKFNLEEFRVQMRLAHLLFSSCKILSVLSSKISPNSLKKAKMFAHKTSHVFDDWARLMKSAEDSEFSYSLAKDNFFELMLQHRLREWLLEKVVEGGKLSDRDEQGQGVIHLCAILGYTWSVYPFSWAGLSLDYRDKFGWTALHWAAYFGREKMIAMLQSAGAKSYLVTDPTSENPGGATAADLASKSGYEGLAAFLAEKSLVEHFRDMKVAGNATGSLQATTDDAVITGNFTEEELHLKDTLAAFRTAADAAAHIQSAFRDHSFKLRKKAVESSNPETDARNMIAAMKIQHAFRNFERRKEMAAAARIQCRFRTWKMRKDFINLRRQTIRIQAVFRGHQARKQYKKIVWSVGVLEKAILRWRLKKRGFRGLQVNPDEGLGSQNQDNDVEEDFFQASRKQAEERVERSVGEVQAMFHSKRAQEEYRRMKLAHNEASAEYEGLHEPDMDMV